MQADEAALAVPYAFHGAAPAGGLGVPLPRPLSPSDAATMKRVFAYQAKGNVPEAVRASGDLRNDLLMGPLLADRYLGRSHRSTVAELADWLRLYHDQPDAPAVHALLVSKLPAGSVPPVTPDVVSLSRSTEAPSADIDAQRNDLPSAGALDRIVVDRAQRGKASQALRLIATDRSLSAAYAAQLRAEVAQVLFTRNEDAEALRIVEESIRVVASSDQNGLTYYIAGLASWRLDRTEQARHYFESGAEAAISSPRLLAANAFWASRANRRLHHLGATVGWLRRAARERTTFHGIMARRILRMEIGLVPGGELLTEADVTAVAATPQGWRAFALLQVDQPARAEAELRALWPEIQASPVFGRSVLLVASATGLNDFAAQLAGLLQAADGHRFDALRFPVPRLRPSGGFRVDPALVYGLTMTESKFVNSAVSAGGARGLMQIMPATAQYIAGALPRPEQQLQDPAFNLDIGQRYVAYLARLDGIDNDLIRLLASYNNGPGNLLHWIQDIRCNDDPLLFIEAIPTPETRAFVPEVLAATWIYAAMLHRPSPSLDSLAAGDFPRFTPLPGQGTIANVALRLN